MSCHIEMDKKMKMYIRRTTGKEEILQCPYCKSENICNQADLKGPDGGYYVECLDCRNMRYHDFCVPSKLEDWIKK